MQRPAEKRIHIIVASLVATALIAASPTAVQAGGASRGAGSVLMLYAGIVTSFCIHEGAHALAAELTGTDMNWQWGDINQPFQFSENADSDVKGTLINASGLLAQAAAGEVILRVDKIDKNSPFVRGMMLWNVINPIVYAIDYWFLHETNEDDGGKYKGDLQGIEEYTNETTAHGFALSMAALAAHQGYRFLKTQSWAPDWVKGKTHHLNFAPMPTGGLVVTYEYSF